MTREKIAKKGGNFQLKSKLCNKQPVSMKAANNFWSIDIEMREAREKKRSEWISFISIRWHIKWNVCTLLCKIYLMKFPKCPINCIRIRIAIRRFDHFYSWYCVKFESDGISRAVFYLNKHQFPCHWYFRENGDRTTQWVSLSLESVKEILSHVYCVLVISRHILLVHKYFTISVHFKLCLFTIYIFPPFHSFFIT